MIKAVIFDMDGVLVQNERLKGLSVGMAVQRLRGLAEPDPRGVKDSPNGVRAGVAAGMNVVAFGTPFTIDSLHAAQVVDHRWIVHDPERLPEVAEERIAEHNRTAH